ncbi:endonuclease [Algisphaera agarilytica]|uniref:Endonuclease I n=1 Tax=Algisphaera agarilytica TaxID=1385975 RepID=A0A7X0LKC1_9BACT|nr:endonuclease [Algisphaera agarilytica]MBB6429689.1 endonuclease I [Algisphaera agarilytica]
MAGPYDAPATYYDTATGTGSTLKSQLHNIIDGHTVFSYGDARTILQITDQDPNDSDRMLLVYDRTSLDVSAINPNGSIPGWDSGVSWNREHTWPRSRGVNSSGPDNSDLHQLRPSDNGINSDRGSLNFGGAFGSNGGSYGTVSDGGTFWYPGDADAGMIARQQFYMAVRYDGSDSDTQDLELSSGNPGSGLGNLDRLIEWHFAAPADDFELRRNDVIYDNYQGNRNPFVDRPEFVWSVFVDQQNDSRLSLGGTTVNSDGSSTLDLDLGQVFVGGAAPTSDTVALNKTGNDGTYYSVTTTGSVTSNITGRLNAFQTGTTGSETLQIGVNADASSAGAFGGTVTIDNLDVTTAGGTGRGDNDGDDVINVTYSVFDHATASFASDSVTKSLQIDFGTVDVGFNSGQVAEVFSLFNQESTVDFTSALSVGSWSEVAGDGSAFDFLAAFPIEGDLNAGDSRLQAALLDTTSAGVFSATYELEVGDALEAAGALTETLTLTLLAEVVSSVLAGDYNGNGVVDAADYTVWQDSFGSTVDLAADGNGNGVVDAADYTVWQDNFGSTSGGGSSVVIPEPGTVTLVLVSLMGMAGRRQRRQR